MEFFAHVRDDGTSQSVKMHSACAGEFAAEAVSSVGLENAARLAGLLHDAGKCKKDSQEYLLNAVSGCKPVRRGSVNHTFAGARYLLKKWHTSEEIGLEELTAELLAFAIGSHHGLFDCIDENGKNGFSHRINATNIDYEESMANYFSHCFSYEEIECKFPLAVQEIEKVYLRLLKARENLDDRTLYFQFGLLARLILSALIEGDRRDTAEFMNNKAFPQWPRDMTEIWRVTLERVERKLMDFSCERPIDRARRRISDQCAAFAKKPSGIYRLNVPTGSGKTLSGLRYALTHANIWNESRIIFLSPLLSILDQNAKTIRSFVEDDRLILEHHSDFICSSNENDGERDNWELLTETWNSPIIITTLVQFLNTLFSGQTSCIRRFHSLCNSVIVVDEVQTVPNKMLSLFNSALTFLTEVCGATILLCSATQPGLENAQRPLPKTPEEIVPYDASLWKVFQRTIIQDGGECSLEEIPNVILSSLSGAQSLLVVCNKKAEAAYLFHAVNENGIRCFHLSASMCVAHRKKVLNELRQALEESKRGGSKVLCVSTQVIEAGVDISFQRVIRLAAGMDSVVQSAGRCNRNGESRIPQPVTILHCTGEKLEYLEDIRRGQNATLKLIVAYQENPSLFDGVLDSDCAIKYYYRILYNTMDIGYQDFAADKHGTLFDLLSVNSKYADVHSEDCEKYLLRQPFRLAGRLFQVFDEDTISVLVPYEEGREIQENLRAADKAYVTDYAEMEKLLNKAKAYCISVYHNQLKELTEKGAAVGLFDGRIYVLTDGYYDKDTGFSMKLENSFWEG